MAEGNPEGVALLKKRAVDRLMTIIDLPTPEKRRAQAEWIVEAILDAAVATNAQMNLEALP